MSSSSAEAHWLGAERMLAAARIVAQHNRSEQVVCVVSAMAGVTDGLFAIASLAARAHPTGAPCTPHCALSTNKHWTSLAPAGDDMESVALAPLWRMLESDVSNAGSHA